MLQVYKNSLSGFKAKLFFEEKITNISENYNWKYNPYKFFSQVSYMKCNLSIDIDKI